MNYLPIKLQRAQRNIQRCSLATKIQDYDLMQHSFGVLSICCDLVRIFNLKPLTQEEVELILRHDIAETLTGDLPYNIKNMSAEVQEKWEFIENAVLQEHSKEIPELEKYSDSNLAKTLSEEKFKLFKIADMLDLLLYCCKEDTLGNSDPEMQTIFKNSLRLALKQIQDFCKDFTNRQDLALKSFKEYLQSSGYRCFENCSELQIMED